jgi:hypothetical protein
MRGRTDLIKIHHALAQAWIPTEITMKGLAAIGAAAFIALAGVLWFMTKPALVVTEIRPLQASPDLPTFKRAR